MPTSRWCLDFVNIFRENFFFVLEKEFQILTHSFPVHPFSSPWVEDGSIMNHWKFYVTPVLKQVTRKKFKKLRERFFLFFFFAEILYLRWPIKNFLWHYIPGCTNFQWEESCVLFHNYGNYHQWCRAIYFESYYGESLNYIQSCHQTTNQYPTFMDKCISKRLCMTLWVSKRRRMIQGKSRARYHWKLKLDS